MIQTSDSNTVLTCLSPAKLNLFLHITGIRADGYHTLQTLFQLLDWGDTLRFSLSNIPGVRIQSGFNGMPDDDNLIIRAARLLARPDLGVDIEVDKVIPMGGGLGGGSSNAATTLLALNALWGLDFSVQQLADMGLQLGADVPVFVRGRTAWAEGIGEVLQPLTLPASWYVILVPDCHVSTGEIFSDLHLTRDTAPITISAFFAGQIRNDLQAVVEQRYPAVRNALIWLNKYSPAIMTGSGACVFSAVDKEADARTIAAAASEALPALKQVVVARGTNYSRLT
tara:strand:+ start:82 stop:930 length:849 start_codon:yes stop_codon:yes gene_type:complete